MARTERTCALGTRITDATQKAAEWTAEKTVEAAAWVGDKLDDVGDAIDKVADSKLNPMNWF